MTKTFGELIKEARENKKIGLRQFASMIRLSPSYLSLLENNHRRPPSFNIILKMAEVLKIDEEYLLAKGGRVTPERIQQLREEIIKKYENNC